MVEIIFSTLALSISIVSLLATLGVIQIKVKNDPYEKYRNEHGLLTNKRQDLEVKRR